MITITVQEEKQKFQQTFHKEKITIGFAPPGKVDLPLAVSSISEHHVVIALHEGKYRIVNSTHDPLVSLNKHAFGSRNLREGDTLVVHGAILHMDKVKPIQVREEDSEEAIQSLLEQVDALDQLKEHPIEPTPSSLTNPFEAKSYKPVHFIVLIACTLLFLLGSGIYMSFINEQLEFNETEAALFVADAGMALTYAKLYHITAPRDNWSSHEFLKENLEKILAQPETSAISLLSADGWLKNTPYLIRIYTAQNLNKFLIIAQPFSRKSKYFTSKTAIVLDSDHMELRKLEDIKPLNRMLADPKAMDSEFNNIAAIVYSGKLLTLKEIGIEKKRPDLTPPKGLGFIRPGADLKVYNAPRYYKLTDWVIKEADKLEIPEEGTINNLPPFFESLQYLSPLKDLVYYTTEEIEAALHTYEIFHIYLPEEEMLVGWLSLDPQTREIVSSLLITLRGTPHSKQESKPQSTAVPHSLTTTDVDMHSHWFEEMTGIRLNRTKNLEPLSEAMSHLLKQHTQEVDPNFEGRFYHLQKNFVQIDKEELATITQKLHDLYVQYKEQEPYSSPNRFLHFIRMTGLEFFVDANIMKEMEQDEIDRLAMDKVDQYMKRIKGAQKMSELEKHATSFNEFIEQSLASKTVKTAIYQQMREEISKKLDFLLSIEMNEVPIANEESSFLQQLLNKNHTMDTSPDFSDKLERR